jgi:hypothetical protein
MPHCGARFDENSVPPWTKGDFRGVGSGLSGRPSQTGHDNPLKASRPPSFRLLSPFGEGDFRRSKTMVIRPTSEFRISSASETQALEKILSEENRPSGKPQHSRSSTARSVS